MNNKVDIFYNNGKLMMSFSLEDGRKGILTDPEMVNRFLENFRSSRPHSISYDKDSIKILYNNAIINARDYGLKNNAFYDQYINSVLDFDEKRRREDRQNKILQPQVKRRKVNRGRSALMAGGVVIFGGFLITSSSKDILKKDVVNTDISNDTISSSNSDLTTSNVLDNYTFQNNYETSLDNKAEPNYENFATNIVETYLDYEDLSNSDTAIKVRTLYGDTIAKYANMYGLSPELMMGVACQESRGDPNADNGYAIGLMQVERVWIQQGSITAYNFETHQDETFNITEDVLRSVDGNIKARTMITAYYTKRMNGNPLMGLQCCIGEGNMNRILDAYKAATGISRNDAKNDYSNLDWINYGKAASSGDTNYVRHVLRFVSPDARIVTRSSDGVVSEVIVTNQKSIVKS